VCGTAVYVAPEIVKKTSAKGYGAAADIWSFGIIAYILLTGGGCTS
jgi:serine/threonine protein kinase